jgi:hypothetical protein
MGEVQGILYSVSISAGKETVHTEPEVVMNK